MNELEVEQLKQCSFESLDMQENGMAGISFKDDSLPSNYV